ncbi:MAG: PTS sugar transporter subunit IIA [Candidatus Aureabacteria bacterium]|nr:PTS sugar transporter subunit IIA [Candidatus Auribacterota bacterium]
MLEKFIRPERIVLDLNIKNKWKILEVLTRIYCKDMPDKIKDNIFYSVLWREMKFSTGLGGGIAIPHGRTECVSELGLLFARFNKSINWHSIDSKRVNYVFLVIGPMDATETYLNILSNISKLLSRKMMRKTILETNNIKKICQLILNSEERKTKRYK